MLNPPPLANPHLSTWSIVCRKARWVIERSVLDLLGQLPAIRFSQRGFCLGWRKEG